MANHPSALKRARQAIKRQARNRSAVSAMKTTVKKVDLAIVKKEPEAIKVALKVATSSLAKTASKGIIPKKRASRKISRLALRVNKLTSASS